jgi:ABC-type glycerol-3-phosphate transport system substrate-binding protein
MHKNIKLKLASVFLLFVLITTSAFGCKNSTTAEEAQKVQSITLNFWSVWDSSDTFSDIIAAYRTLHPNISIKYRKLRYEEYESTLIDGFAEDRGPDIFSVHAGWMKRYQTKLTPLPPTITMAYSVTTGSIQKTETVELRTATSLTTAQMQNDFVPAVYDNAVLSGQIYGLPLSVDTMVLYYNRDLLNNAGVTDIPVYWNDSFLQAVKKLTRKNEQGDIVQAGVPLGASLNIERYTDILSLLMMQNGAEMVDSQGRVSFHKTPAGFSQDAAPGAEALRFYTDFANPLKDVYTWDADMPNSLQAFIDGTSAFFFGYAYHAPQIRARAPRLNFGVGKMLQIEGSKLETNFANFWLEGVSAQSAYPSEAWDFIQFATAAENVQGYLNKAQLPTARKSLINQQLADPNLQVFASQLLTAKTWYCGNDYNAAEVIMGDMIDQTLLDPTQAPKIMQTAAQKIQQTIGN